MLMSCMYLVGQSHTQSHLRWKLVRGIPGSQEGKRGMMMLHRPARREPYILGHNTWVKQVLVSVSILSPPWQRLKKLGKVGVASPLTPTGHSHLSQPLLSPQHS